MLQAKDIQLQTSRSPPGLQKIQVLNKRMRWGINRLQSLPSLFITGASAISPSPVEEESHVTSFPIKEKWFPDDSEKLSEEERAEKEVEWRRFKELEKKTLRYPEDEEWAVISKYNNVLRNEFFLREHVVQKEVDICVCECSPETECRQRCLNALLSVECTPNNCPCGALCQNQKFQKREYARVRKEGTYDRGWGLFADQDIKESDFVIEYCGEVISDTVALSRLRAYKAAGLKETYMMSLDGTERLDATRKGNLARFINHSCEPNCKTKKWTVLGEMRIGIFAAKDIKSGEELTYNYRFELYEDTKTKCLCGSPSCVGLLGTKSQASQEVVESKDTLMQEAVESEDTLMQEAVESEDNKSRSSVQNVGLDIFVTSNEGDLCNQDLLTRLYLVAAGVFNYGLPAQPKRQQQEITAPAGAPVPKYKLPPQVACFEFQVF